MAYRENALSEFESIGAGDGIGPRRLEAVDTTSRIYTLIQEAERAVDQQRFELAQALAAIAQARAVADIANALRDDVGNGAADILSSISFNVDVIARNTDARDSLAQTVAIYGS